MKARRKEFKMWMKENMHKPVYEIMETIKRKLIEHYDYYGINGETLADVFVGNVCREQVQTYVEHCKWYAHMKKLCADIL